MLLNASHLPEAKRTEADLAERIISHLRGSDDKQKVALVWEGYVAALTEWGQIELDVFSRLFALLPEGDRPETGLIALGFHDEEG